MEGLFRTLEEVDDSVYINVARFRLRPEEYDVTKDMILTDEIVSDKEIK
jgi:hypothetical protein